jgi:hypothetical protein
MNKLMKTAVLTLSLLLVSAVMAVPSRTAGPESSAIELLRGVEAGSGWSAEGEPSVYHSDNLWEYINGSAEKFISYDFREAAVQNYTDGEENELKLEIYQHGSSSMAYGIYSQFRRGREENESTGKLAFSGDYSLHFWKGDFYVRLSVYEEDEKLKEAMRDIAGAVAERIKEEGTLPEGLSYLPEEGIEKESVGYVAEGVLGSGKLPPAVTARYLWGDSSGKLYIFVFDIAREGMAMFKELSGKVEGDPLVKKGGATVHRRVSGPMKYRGKVTLFQYDRIAGVVTGFEDSPEAAGKLERKVIEKYASHAKPLVK